MNERPEEASEMQNLSVTETLASMERVRRRARDAASASGWLLTTAIGLSLVVVGLFMLGIYSWPLVIVYYGLAIPLLVLGVRARVRHRTRLGLAVRPRRRWLLTTAVLPIIVGGSLVYLPVLAALRLLGTAVLVAAIVSLAIHERSMAIGIGAAVWAVAAAIAWIEAPTSYSGLMSIAMGLVLALIGLVFWRRLPPPQGTRADPLSAD